MKKVVIIGAGPAGLTAGYELLKDGKNEYEVVILEADNRIGGISKTVNVDGNRMDLGGHRFFSKDDTVMKFWEELMPIQGEKSFDDKKLEREKPLKEGGPNPETENRVMLVRDRV
ncbi:MAG: FAD-dependent oxidoreductase, partial [Clostridia bacterium]